MQLIKYTFLSVFALHCGIGTVMIRSAGRYGKLSLFLGLLNIAWAVNTVIFSFILETPQIPPYIASQTILLLNAIGLIQLFLKEQRNEIERGSEQITYLTYHDELTGLYNRTYFEKKMQEMADNNERLPVSMLIGDMNGGTVMVILRD